MNPSAWSMVFLATAVLAGFAGFSSLAGKRIGFAKFLFLALLMLSVFSLFSR